MMDVPDIALSVRQPWAWAIIYAGKDIENRSWQAANHGLRRRGRVAIHASKGITQEEYEDARELMAVYGEPAPPAHELLRGGIIGSVEVVDVVSRHDSPWFFGPRGLVLKDPRPCEFIPAKGELGYFKWRRGKPEDIPPPARWMLPRPPAVSKEATPTLFPEVKG